MIDEGLKMNYFPLLLVVLFSGCSALPAMPVCPEITLKVCPSVQVAK